MLQFSPNHFFNLGQWAHPSLFKEVHCVWEVFHNLKSYIRSLNLGKIEINIPSGVNLFNVEQISIGPGTKIEPGSCIIGPCFIGKNCQVRHGAYIRGDVLIGDHCVIGHDTEIKHSICLNGAHAAHFAYIGDTILGNHVNLGAGVKCANLRLNKALIDILYQTQKIPTHLKKLGAIVGDNVQLGCNSVTNPGTLIGKGCLSYPNTTISGYIPSGHVIKPAAKFNVYPLSHGIS